jgi:hypothetical protein
MAQRRNGAKAFPVEHLSPLAPICNWCLKIYGTDYASLNPRQPMGATASAGANLQLVAKNLIKPFLPQT